MVLDRGEKYVLEAYSPKGKIFRYALDSLILPGAAAPTAAPTAATAFK